MDKSYAEAQGIATVDWPQVIQRLGTMSDAEHEQIYKLSLEWPTCACGSQCAIIPRHDMGNGRFKMGAPVDSELQGLGSRFPAFIRQRHVNAAQQCWEKIEARSALLIEQELAQLTAATAPRTGADGRGEVLS